MALDEVRLNQAMGKVLRRFRDDLGFSQAAMGRFLGIGSQTAVTNIELGRRPIQAAEVWAWAERIADRHPLSALEIREEFFASPFVERLGQTESPITSWMPLDAKKEAPEGASVNPSPSTAGSQDQMSYYRNIDRMRDCENIQWVFIPSRSRSRELPPGLRGPNACSVQGREILTDLA
jgi:transcriptional regulator with XRE-family HTH domain